MTDQWTDRLSEYVDGGLDAAAAGALQAHLTECGACAAIVEDLRAVTQRARSLTDRVPERDLWPGIAPQLERSGAVTSLSAWQRLRGRRIAVTVPQLAAAGLALLLMSAGTVWLAVGGAGAPSGAPVPAPALVVTAGASGIRAEYEPAVRDLEQVLAEHRDRLDTATVRVLEESLATIDRAIAEATAALEEDPANPYLTGHLTTVMRRKVEVLRQAATLAAASS
jgi:anti-sigma factor RsiW